MCRTKSRRSTGTESGNSRKRKRDFVHARFYINGGVCDYCECGVRIEAPPPGEVQSADMATCDHFDPVTRENDREWNYRLACARCNEIKGTMMGAEWIAYMATPEYMQALEKWTARREEVIARKALANHPIAG